MMNKLPPIKGNGYVVAGTDGQEYYSSQPWGMGSTQYSGIYPGSYTNFDQSHAGEVTQTEVIRRLGELTDRVNMMIDFIKVHEEIAKDLVSRLSVAEGKVRVLEEEKLILEKLRQ